MPMSEALKRAQKKYEEKNTRLVIRMSKEARTELEDQAKNAGLPLTTYIKRKLGI